MPYSASISRPRAFNASDGPRRHLTILTLIDFPDEFQATLPWALEQYRCRSLANSNRVENICFEAITHFR